jgi:hypothetical protein
MYRRVRSWYFSVVLGARFGSTTSRSQYANTVSVDLVAYLARYDATWPSVTSPAGARLMARTSSCVPQAMFQPSGLPGWATVANQVDPRHRADAVGQVLCGQAGRLVDDRGWVVGSCPSRRMSA